MLCFGKHSDAYNIINIYTCQYMGSRLSNLVGTESVQISDMSFFTKIMVFE